MNYKQTLAEINIWGEQASRPVFPEEIHLTENPSLESRRYWEDVCNRLTEGIERSLRLTSEDLTLRVNFGPDSPGYYS
jgi:hypothetical protein